MKRIYFTLFLLLFFSLSAVYSQASTPEEDTTNPLKRAAAGSLDEPSRKKQKTNSGKSLSIKRDDISAPPLTIADLTDLMAGYYEYNNKKYTLAGKCSVELIKWTQGNYCDVTNEGARNLKAMQDYRRNKLLCLSPQAIQSPSDAMIVGYCYIYFSTLLDRPGPLEGYPIIIERSKECGEELAEYTKENLQKTQDLYLKDLEHLPVLLASQAETDYMNELFEGSAVHATKREILEKQVRVARLLPEKFAAAQAELATMYCQPLSGEVDHTRARELFEAALDSGHLPEQYTAIVQAELAYMYRYALGGLGDFIKARGLLEAALESPHFPEKNTATAQLELAAMYHHAFGGTVDLTQARILLEAALKSPHLPNQFIATARVELATIYHRAPGQNTDLRRARGFLKAALNSGHLLEQYTTIAQFELAYMYRYALGGRVDLTQARILLKAALDSGHLPGQNAATAQVELAGMYYCARGGVANFIQARTLLKAALDSGHLPEHKRAQVRGFLSRVVTAITSDEGSSSR